jgi:hypothetical protein
MYAIPHVLTGIGALCGLFKGMACNGYGKDCLAYEPHNKKSLAVLNKVIEEKKLKESKVKE